MGFARLRDMERDKFGWLSEQPGLYNVSYLRRLFYVVDREVGDRWVRIKFVDDASESRVDGQAEVFVFDNMEVDA